MRARALGAMIGLALGLGSVVAAGAAEAADLPGAPFANHSWHYPAHGRRAGVIVIVDDQPGIVVRDYWRAPWRHRHYYPATGKRPRIGRLERLAAKSHPQHAESYRRSWSASSAFLPEPPPGGDIDAEPPLK